MAAPITLQRLLTYQDTIVFIDNWSGELRHGQAAYSPHNVFFMVREGAGYLIHARANGGLSEIVVSPGLGSTPVQLLDLTPELLQPWSLMPVEGSALGLFRSGLYLCAELDGRVTLSRPQLGPWERFSLQSNTERIRSEGGGDIRQRASALYLAAQRAGKEDGRGALLDINMTSDTLVISCSGIVPGNNIIYAMENSSKDIATTKLFLCDNKSLWYYQGIEGLSSNFNETIDLVH